MIDYPKELSRIRVEDPTYESPKDLYRLYLRDTKILLSYIEELSKVATVNVVCTSELKSLNRLRDNLNDFIRDNVVVLAEAGAE